MNLYARLDQLKGIAIDFLFPPRCFECGKGGEFLCLSCRRAFPPLLGPLCLKCGKPLSPEGSCFGCERWKLVLDGIRSPFRFEGVTRQAVHRLKYDNFKVLALPLAQLLEEYLRRTSLPVEVLVPVPLHVHRLRTRGYNQSSLLAKELGKLTGLPVVEESLLRFRDTPAQTRTTSAEARRSNVYGAFICQDQRLHGRQVILIDDVCTSGATLDACALALKEVGTSSVWGLTVAREV